MSVFDENDKRHSLDRIAEFRGMERKCYGPEAPADLGPELYFWDRDLEVFLEADAPFKERVLSQIKDVGSTQKGLADNFRNWRYHHFPLAVVGYLVVVGGISRWGRLWLCLFFWILGKLRGVEVVE